jgi:acetyltransferase-like isoleucine patch superfamily enzyme
LPASIRGFIQRVSVAFEKRKYSPSNISEFFRKQGAQVGDNCFIVPTMLGTEPYLVKIGNRVAIAQGVQFITHDGGTFIFRNEIPNIQGFGTILIEDNCLIGQNAILFPNIRIGPNSIVAAGSVVIADVPPNTIVMGVPARPFGSIDKYKEKCLERWKAQEPPDAILEAGETWWTSRHFTENREKLRKHLIELFRDRLR